jgi:hypothetical protein
MSADQLITAQAALGLAIPLPLQVAADQLIE